MVSDMKDNFVVIPEPKITVQEDMPGVFLMDPCNGHDLYEISADKLQHLFSTEALSSVEYVVYCLERVRKVRT